MAQASRVYFISSCLSVICALKNNAQFAAFQSISKALVKTEHEISVMSINGSSDFIEFAVLPNFRHQNVPHSVAAFNSMNSPEYHGINTSAVIAFDSIDSIKNFNNETYFCSKPKFNHLTTLKSDNHYPFQFFVYCPGMTMTDLLTFKDNEPPKSSVMLRNEYFIVDEGNFINLWTFVWFTANKCNQMQLEMVNRFSKKTKKWKHDAFVVEKFKNFHGCVLEFSFRTYFPEYVEVSMRSDEGCYGYLCRTAQALSTNMNFSYKSHLHDLDTELNNSMEYKMDLNWESASIAVAMQAFSNIGFNYFFSSPFAYREMFIVIPEGADLDSYERIIRPFDNATWMWLIITFAAAFATILFRKFMKNRLQDFVIGFDTLTPGMNVLRIFFGISQIKCPDRNYPRFFVMSFILFCLVIRTGYQGKMFEFLQKDLKRPTFDTIDELIDDNFTFYMRNNFKLLYAGIDLVKRATIVEIWRYEDFDHAIEMVQKPGHKVATELDFNRRLELASQANVSLQVKTLNERLLLECDVLVLPAHHRLFNTFNSKFKLMFEAGLFDFYIREAQEAEIRRIRPDSEEPFKVLTLDELEAGFVVSLVPLLLAALVFGLEWIVRLKDLLVVSLLFKAYFEMNKIN